MQLPIVYRKSPEFAVQFDFFDLADGSAIVELDAGTTTTAQTGVLSKVAFFSEKADSYHTQSGNSVDAKRQEQAFYLDVNLPITLAAGQVTINCNHRAESTGGGANIAVSYLKAYLYKVSGGTTTQLGTDTSSSITCSSAAGFTNRSLYAHMQFDIVETPFAKGDKIKLLIEQWGAGDGDTGEKRRWFAHDPKNRTTGFNNGTNSAPITVTWTEGSRLIVQLPIKIDL